jgi:hypothetical protein
MTIAELSGRIQELSGRQGKFSIKIGEFFSLLKDIVKKMEEVIHGAPISLIYRPDVANLAALNAIQDSEKGWAVAVLDQVDGHGGVYIYQYDGAGWNRTPFSVISGGIGQAFEKVREEMNRYIPLSGTFGSGSKVTGRIEFAVAPSDSPIGISMSGVDAYVSMSDSGLSLSHYSGSVGLHAKMGLLGTLNFQPVMLFNGNETIVAYGNVSNENSRLRISPSTAQLRSQQTTVRGSQLVELVSSDGVGEFKPFIYNAASNTTVINKPSSGTIKIFDPNSGHSLAMFQGQNISLRTNANGGSSLSLINGLARLSSSNIILSTAVLNMPDIPEETEANYVYVSMGDGLHKISISNFKALLNS